ncbi:MAG: hypothetical protein IT169_10320 [Bryobacterales bacterium]|nr:hypothetical protein [Bryobacterales bacterium]
MQKPTDSAVPKSKNLKPSTARAAKKAPAAQCTICGSEVAPISNEPLCWVCRRLKVSAWSENTDSQMFAPE